MTLLDGSAPSLGGNPERCDICGEIYYVGLKGYPNDKRQVDRMLHRHYAEFHPDKVEPEPEPVKPDAPAEPSPIPKNWWTPE